MPTYILFTENLSTALTNNLRDDYIKNKCSLDSEEWPPNQPKTVVNVALIHYKGSRTEQELIEISKRHKEGAPAVDKLARHSRVTKDISIIFQTDVTNNTEAKPLKLILIEGAPGIGKTVLARRIAYLWAKDELLTKVNTLFLLFLRDPKLQSIKTAGQLIQYLSSDDLNEEEVKNCVQQIKELQVGIVMDGYDEYPIKLRKRSFIADVIKGKVFHNCTIVLTSRPTATINLHGIVDRRVEILGFAQEDRDKYICESLDSPEQRKQIQDYLKCQPIINGLVYVPLHLAVLLFLFKVQSKLPETLTEMNELFILHTIYRSLSKDDIITEDEVTAINCIEDLPDNISGIIKGLSKLAFTGLQNDQLVFTWDVITVSCPQIKNNIPGAFNGFGLLQAVQHYLKTGQPGVTVSFNFLHFTMQEFLAALHVSDASVIPYEQQLSLMETTFWKSTFNFMWMMYVGINGVNSKTFMEFLYKVQPGTDIKQLELSNDIKSDKRKCLHLFQCFMEAKSAEIPKEISSILYNNEINFQGLQLLPHHILSLTLYLSKYSMQLETFNFRDCHMGDVGMSILEHYFTTNPNKASTIKHIDLFGNDSLLLRNVYCAIFSQQNLIKLNWSSLGKVNIEEILAVMNNNKVVQSLNLSDNDFNDDDAERIVGVLVNNNTLKEINFSGNKFTTKGAVAISSCVQKNIKLQHLIISWNNLSINTDHQTIDFSQRSVSDTDVQIVTNILCKNETVIKLDLSCNKISDKGAKSICMCIESNKSLKEIDISGNRFSTAGLKKILGAVQINLTIQKFSISHYKISDDRVIAISEYLKNNSTLQELNLSHSIISSGMISIYKALQMNTALQIFDISHNNTTAEGAIAISECLKNNNILQKLDMSHNQLTDIAIATIGKALQINKMLQVLVISHNNITDEGAVAISECLKNNNTLQEFDISYNKVSDNGVANISKALQINTTLKILLISHNNISDDGVVAIGKTLQSHKDYSIVTTNKEIIINEDHIKHSALQKLNLSCNKISSKGIEAFCNYLKCNITLQELIISWDNRKTPVVLNSTKRFCNISNLHFGNVGATLLLAFLFRKDETRILDISHNAISDDGAVAISEYFKYNGMLQELNISHNEITSEGIVEILKSIHSDSPLHTLNLTHNIVTKPGLMLIYDIYKKCSNVPSMQISYNKIVDNSQKIDTFLVSFKNNHKKSFDQLKTTKVNFNGSASYRAQVLCFCATENESIKELDISRHGITNKVAKTIAKALQGNVSLQELDISNNKISDDGTVAITVWFKNNNTLQKLNISYNQVFNIGINEIAKALQMQRTLQMLNISHNNISDDGVIAISECLKANTSLKELDISNNKITNDGIIKIAEAIKVNTTLSLLDVSKNNMDRSTKVATVFSDHLKHNNILNVLGISWNVSDTTYVYHVGINNECYVDTSWLKFKRSLASVNWNSYYYLKLVNWDSYYYDKPEFDYIEAILLIALVYGNVDVKTIKIVDTKISDSAALVISDFLKVNNTIETLKLSDSTISTKAIKQTIRAFQANTTLQILDISSNKISDDVVVAISECLKANATLKELDISNNKITNDGIMEIAEAIKANTTLSLLDVSGNKMYRSTEVARALSDHLKHNNTLQALKISWNDNDSDTTYDYRVGMNNECYVDITLPKFKRSLASVNWERYYYDKPVFDYIEAILLIALVYGNVDVKTIKIINNKISDSAALVISDFLKANKTIETLKLSNNTISTEATKRIIKDIQTNTTLQLLDIS